MLGVAEKAHITKTNNKNKKKNLNTKIIKTIIKPKGNKTMQWMAEIIH